MSKMFKKCKPIKNNKNTIISKNVQCQIRIKQMFNIKLELEIKMNGRTIPFNLAN